MAKYLKITAAELEALIETADSCEAMGDELEDEANAAISAYQAVLKRNRMTIEDDARQSIIPDNICQDQET